MEPCAPKWKRSLLLCGHCDCYVLKLTYYCHHDTYFNPLLGSWDRVDDGSVADHDASSQDGILLHKYS